MALTNANRGWLVLTTGNKSELAVGYSTLYGDTAGGFAVIKDVPKTARLRPLPPRQRARPAARSCPSRSSPSRRRPSSGPDQRDDQSLPPYEVLDPLLEAYVERDHTASASSSPPGSTTALVARITRLVDVAEYKRRQNPPGPRITAKAFGKDRRIPITNHYGR